MKTILGLGLTLLFVCGCSTVPDTKKSTYLVTAPGGAGWRGKMGGDAYSANIDLQARPGAPDVIYLEAAFPNPMQPGTQDYVRKEFHKADGTLHMEGPERTGWVDGKTYNYLVVIFADGTYKTVIDVHVQPVRYFDPRLHSPK
jgi:hypothetical protein